MPYIKPEDRKLLDDSINRLVADIDAITDKSADPGAFAGVLNYCCTKLALSVLPERRYWAIAIVSGVFHNIADEFYRRYAAPYEDEQIQKNGDVY